jgi:hypothetical protein
LRDKALPEGQVREPVAGYLYFPRPAKKPKKSLLELEYSNQGGTVTLTFPK